MNKGIGFLKILNVTERLDVLDKMGISLDYKNNNYKEVYITNDVNDIWVYRVLEDTNSDYEYEEGTYLIERECIDKNELVEFMKKNIDGNDNVVLSKEDICSYLKNASTGDIVDSILIIDSENCFENWDSTQCGSYSKVKEVILESYDLEELDYNYPLSVKNY
ncbi:hypothetical protein ACSW8S_17030 (plasmid) [Clostridium perfringens]